MNSNERGILSDSEYIPAMSLLPQNVNDCPSPMDFSSSNVVPNQPNDCLSKWHRDSRANQRTPFPEGPPPIFNPQPGSTVSSKMPSIQDEKHECFVCKATFTSKMYLDTHLSEIHKRGLAHNQASRKFKCEQCSEQFFSEDYLKTHVRKKHFTMSDWENCSFCNEIFETRNELISHTEERHSLRDKNTASSHTGFNLDSTVHSDENPTIDCDNSDLNVSQADFLNGQQNSAHSMGDRMEHDKNDRHDSVR